MAVGFPTKVSYANGDVFSASDINDTNGTLNLLGSSVAYAAGKNDILNADFGIWQRGTSFSSPASGTYTADRWLTAFDGTAGTYTISQQTFTPGTAPVSGYEGSFFLRYAVTNAGTGGSVRAIDQRIEDVRTFAGQTVNISFWAKADASRSIGVQLLQTFGSGGSSAVTTSATSQTATTSWARYTTSVAVPSISGKTIGTSSYLALRLTIPYGTTSTVDFWGVQVEQGSTATAFALATGNPASELAACQRYYWRVTADSSNVYASFGNGVVTATTSAYVYVQNPVVMRVAPDTVDFSTLTFANYGLTLYTVTALAFTSNRAGRLGSLMTATASGMFAGQGGWLGSNNSATGYIGFGAEL